MCVYVIYIFVFPQLLNLTIQAMMWSSLVSKWKRNQAEIHRTNAQRMEWWNRMRIILNHAPTSQTTRIEKAEKTLTGSYQWEVLRSNMRPYSLLAKLRNLHVHAWLRPAHHKKCWNVSRTCQSVTKGVLTENTESKSKAERNQNRQTLRLIVLPIVLPIQSKKQPRCVWSKL